jgi:hypothetical protein
MMPSKFIQNVVGNLANTFVSISIVGKKGEMKKGHHNS